MKMGRQTSSRLVFLGSLLLLATSIPSPSHLVHGFIVAPPAPSAQTVLLSSSTTALCATQKTTAKDDSSRCDVAIFGGGFGGLYTALSVARLNPDLDVALVEPSDSFVFLPLLYDLTVGTATESEVCPFYSDLLREVPSVRHVKASLTRLEAPSNTAVFNDNNTLQYSAAVVAVGATPQAILKRVPGALECAQPFYTATHAKQTRRLLNKLDEQLRQQASKTSTTASSPTTTRIAIVGGGFGGVELAASVQRRLRDQNAVEVVLLSRGKPMGGTRAEAWIDAALEKLGVQVLDGCTVQSLVRSSSDNNKKITMVRKQIIEDEEAIVQDEWDTVLWTAGSGPADPVASQECIGLKLSGSGRLTVDGTLRCLWEDNGNDKSKNSQPCIWALGDCAEIVNNSSEEPVLPKTAQVAMQQADTVADNVVVQLQGKKKNAKTFVYQDLGSMLTLGGPNGAVLSPRTGTFAPIFEPLLDTTARALRVADDVLSSVTGPPAQQLGLPTAEELGMSLGSHGLGVPDGVESGSLAGTLSGAARRAVYAVRMPTNQQRAVSIVSAAISTAASLAKEASERRRNL